MMMMFNKRPFYVVQFIERPFEGIDEYVCVPGAWIITKREANEKVKVAYPPNEDPFVTRQRTQRRERYADDWRFYVAVQKNEFDTYIEAICWIATVNNYGTKLEESSLNRKPHSSAYYSDDKISKNSDKVQMKTNKSKPTAVDNATKKCERSKKQQGQRSVVIIHNQLTSSMKTEKQTNKRFKKIHRAMKLKSRDQSDKSRQLTSRKQSSPAENCREPLSMPVICGDGNDDDNFIDTTKDVQLEPVSESRPSKTPEPPQLKPAKKAPAPVNDSVLELLLTEVSTHQFKKANTHNKHHNMFLSQSTSKVNQPHQLPDLPVTVNSDFNAKKAPEPVNNSVHELCSTEVSTGQSKEANTHNKHHMFLSRPASIVNQPHLLSYFPVTVNSDFIAKKAPAPVNNSVHELCSTEVCTGQSKEANTDNKHHMFLSRPASIVNQPNQLSYLPVAVNSDFIAKKAPAPVNNSVHELCSTEVSTGQSKEANTDNKHHMFLSRPASIVNQPHQLSYLPVTVNSDFIAKKAPAPVNNSVHELCSTEVSAGQYKEANTHNKHHNMFLSPPASRVNQPQQLTHLPITVNSDFISVLQHQVTGDRRSTEVNIKHQRLSDDVFDLSPYRPEPNLVFVSPQEHTSKSRKSAEIKSVPNVPINKKTRLENVVKSISTMNPSNVIMRTSLPGDTVVAQPFLPVQTQLNEASTSATSAISAAQNLSNMAHQSRFFKESSRSDPRYIPTQENYLQQIARMQNMFGRPNLNQQPIDQRVYLQNSMMNGGFITQSQSNLPSHPVSFLPQYKQNTSININHDHMKQALTYGPQRTDPEKSVANSQHLQLPAVNTNQPRFQFHRQEPQTLCESMEKSIPQGFSKGTEIVNMASLPLTCTNREYTDKDPLAQRTLNREPDKHHNVAVTVAPERNPKETVPIMKNSETQTTLSSEYETQLTAVPGNVYRNPRTKKMVVDRATYMDDIMDFERCDDVELQAEDQMRQADEYFTEEQASPDVSGNQSLEAHEIKLNKEIGSKNEGSTVGKVTGADNTFETNTDQIPNVKHLPSTRNMCDLVGTLFEQMSTNLSNTRDMFNNIRKSTLVCVDTYKGLQRKFNELNNLRTPTSSPNSAPQVPKRRPAGNSDDNNKYNNAGGHNVRPRSRRQKFFLTFGLPPEYDPNDSKWTLRHRKIKSGLQELLPRSNVFVNKIGLKKCIKSSFDCKSLARLLLTEVFSKKALAVCSLSGEKAESKQVKAKSVNIEVRPGLDEHARMILLSYVETYGSKRGWNTTNTTAITKSIRTKLQQIRDRQLGCTA